MCGVYVWCVCVCVCVCVSGDSAECAEVNEVYDTMSCLPIASDRAATEGSKYFELGQQPHEFFNSKYLFWMPFDAVDVHSCLCCHRIWSIHARVAHLYGNQNSRLACLQLTMHNVCTALQISK